MPDIGSGFDEQRSEFESTVLGLLRDYAPSVYARVDPARFAVARPLDIGYAAITPTVRRGYARLSNGRTILALGDAHITMDPVTGQGANKASHAAFVAGAAICEATTFDEDFCARVTQQMCEYALPVSDACNARLVAPPQHVVVFWRRLRGTSPSLTSIPEVSTIPITSGTSCRVRIARRSPSC